MENIKNLINNNYTLILIITIILVLALIGYLMDKYLKKDPALKNAQKKEIVSEENIDMTPIGENKSINELMNQPKNNEIK